MARRSELRLNRQSAVNPRRRLAIRITAAGEEWPPFADRDSSLLVETRCKSEAKPGEIGLLFNV